MPGAGTQERKFFQVSSPAPPAWNPARIVKAAGVRAAACNNGSNGRIRPASGTFFRHAPGLARRMQEKSDGAEALRLPQPASDPKRTTCGETSR